MATTYLDNKAAIIAYVDALLVDDPDLNIGDEARDYVKTNSISCTTEDIDDLVSQIVRNTAAVASSLALIIPCSDETTALTTGAAKRTFRMPFALTLTEVRASVTTAPTDTASPLTALLTIDINENVGASPAVVSILSTKITIGAGEFTSTTALTQPVILDYDLADDAELTIDIDSVGATVAGAGLKVTLLGTKP